MFNLDQAVAEWRRQMLAAGIRSPVPLEELESHLREDVEQQTRLGKTTQQAFETAIERLGPARTLKPEFDKTTETKRPWSRKYLGSATGMVLGAFIFFACLCYFFILPLTLGASDQYHSWLGVEDFDRVATGRFSFMCRFVIGVGLGFAIPVGLLALVKARLLDYGKLVRLRPYSLIVNLVLGALLTTPEVVTQIMMFIPLQMLFEASVWIAKFWDRKASYV